MRRPYFKEEQSLKENRWVWMLIILSTLLLFIPLSYITYLQLVKGQPMGNTPMNNESFIYIWIGAIAVWAWVLWVLLKLKLEVRVDEEGLHYKLFPFKPKWNVVSREQIASFEIRRKREWFHGNRIGYHRSYLTKTRSMFIEGSVHLKIVLKNNQKLLIGTQKPGGFERAMRRMMSNDKLQMTSDE